MRSATNELINDGKSKREPDIVKQLRGQLEGYLSESQIDIIMRALDFGAHAHHGQRRKSGEPYIHHPIEVAGILAELNLDHECIAAAILHDTIEDTEVTRNQLTSEFGETIAHLVDGVTKLDKVKFRTRQEATAESFRKLLLAMVRDLRVILIKLADRLHNMRTLESMSQGARRRIARETLDIYAPLAERLGMHQMRNELEERGFANLYPNRYKVISNRVRSLSGNRRGMLRNIRKDLKKAMRDSGVECEVLGRQKSPYSIYRKMIGKELSFSEVSDVYAFRIITETQSDCYVALGAAHQLYQPIPGKFKDYIALPKANGYQSLHSILKTPDGLPIEIQIRTKEMNEIAEYGHASHWAYKYDPTSSERQKRVRGWFSNLFDPNAQDQDSQGFMESIKADLFPDQIFVFTPNGRIIELRRGATVLDFAYAIHTDIGNQAVSCIVDRTPVPLSYTLSSGETVEIKTDENAHPKPEWLGVVETSKARAAIRQFLRNMHQEDSVALGHRLLDKALSTYGSALEDVPPRRMARYLRRHNLERLEDLLQQLATGDMLADIAAVKLLPLMQRRDHKRPDVPPEALSLTGDEGTNVHYADCCYPIPGDRIIAIAEAGRGIVVHRHNCPSGQLMARRAPERCLTVAWGQAMTKNFRSLLRVYSLNVPGVLGSISATIGNAGTNIQHVRQTSDETAGATLMFIINVRDRDQLARVIQRLRHNHYVVKVMREMRSLSAGPLPTRDN